MQLGFGFMPGSNLDFPLRIKTVVSVPGWQSIHNGLAWMQREIC